MDTADTESFIVHGRAGKLGAVRIGWSPDAGFDDPTGLTGLMIEMGETVCATVTGPCYPAADRPGVVALLTAKQAIDEVESVEGGAAVLAEIDQLVTVPPGATP